MEHVMVLGAGTAQVPLIKAAQRMGYLAVVVTIDGPYPGISQADIVSFTDVTDPEAVLEVARQYDVRGVVTCGMDRGIPAQALVCETLGLPGPSVEAAHVSLDKLYMKQRFEKVGVKTAAYRELRSAEDLEDAMRAFGFPLVVKAVDLEGSRGVTIAHDAQEAHEAFKTSIAASGRDYCIAEQFVRGRNIGAEALVQNGRVLFVLPDGTLSHQGKTNVPIGHYMPLDCSEHAIDLIKREVRKAIDVCGFDNCAVNVDLVLDGDEPSIVELSARTGATCLPESLSIYFGVDYYEAMLKVALGEDLGSSFSIGADECTPNATIMIGSPVSGVVSALELPETVPDYVVDMHFIVSPGDSVRKFEGCIDRIGQIIVVGDSTETCLKRIEKSLSLARSSIEISERQGQSADEGKSRAERAESGIA